MVWVEGVPNLRWHADCRTGTQSGSRVHTIWVEGVHNLSEPGTRAEVDSSPASTIEID